MTGVEPFRPAAPAGPAQLYQSFELKRPRGAAHDFWRKATCEEYGCDAWRNGWTTRVPAGSPQAAYIDSCRHGRQFHEVTDLAADYEGVREFLFAPGQRCFAADSHKVPNMREPLYVVRDGDYRGNPTGRKRVHRRGQDWREHMAEELGHIAEARERG